MKKFNIRKEYDYINNTCFAGDLPKLPKTRLVLTTKEQLSRLSVDRVTTGVFIHPPDGPSVIVADQEDWAKTFVILAHEMLHLWDHEEGIIDVPCETDKQGHSVRFLKEELNNIVYMAGQNTAVWDYFCKLVGGDEPTEKAA